MHVLANFGLILALQVARMRAVAILVAACALANVRCAVGTESLKVLISETNGDKFVMPNQGAAVRAIVAAWAAAAAVTHPSPVPARLIGCYPDDDDPSLHNTLTCSSDGRYALGSVQGSGGPGDPGAWGRGGGLVPRVSHESRVTSHESRLILRLMDQYESQLTTRNFTKSA